MTTSTSNITIQIQDPALGEKELEQFTQRLYLRLQSSYRTERIPIPEKPQEKGGGWLTGMLKMSEVEQPEIQVIKKTIEGQYPSYQVQEFHDQNGNLTMLQISPRLSSQKPLTSRENAKQL